MNLKPFLLALKVSVLSLQVPLIAYLFFYAVARLPEPFHPYSIWLAIIAGALGLAVGSRLLWLATAKRPPHQ